ncbi:MAG: hypothetical protein RIT19_2660 [Verrucomicrobiota bacterium]|jgi:hypothetical protein
MSDADPQSLLPRTVETPPSTRGVLCPDCDRLNPADRDACKHCSKPLRVACPSCSAGNERVLTRCRQCGQSLRKGFLSALLGSRPATGGAPARREEEPSGPMGKGVLCCKCERLNPTDLGHCERCGEALHVECPQCHRRNPRVLMHCTSCRGRLHRGPHQASHGGANPGEHSHPHSHPPGTDVATVCAKCTHSNPPGLQRCERCRGHLFVVCRDCGTTNARSEPRCVKCNRRLHRSINERLDPLGAKAVSMKWVYAMGAVLLLTLAWFLLVQFSGLRILE